MGEVSFLEARYKLEAMRQPSKSSLTEQTLDPLAAVPPDRPR